MTRRFVSLSMLMILLLVFASSIHAQPGDNVLREMQDIETLVQDVRAVNRDVAYTWINTADLQRQIAINRQASYSETEASQRALLNYIFGWTPQLQPVQFPETALPLTDVYDYPSKKLYVIEQEPMMSATRQVLYSLTYAQALLDRQFDAGDLLEETGSLDQLLAYAALVNGDSYFTMQRFLDRWFAEHPEKIDEVLRVNAVNFNLDSLNRLLPFTVASETFTYQNGADFVSVIYSLGGWEAVNALYEQPPISTEQILHPDAYDSSDQPQELELLEWKSGAFNLAMDDMLGEFGLLEHLQIGLDPLNARVIASGWDGDHFQIYTNASNQIILIWRLAWDSELDAAEFNENYNLYINARAGVEPINSSGNSLCWDAVLSACLIRGRRQSLVVYAPDLDTAQTIAEMYLPLEP